MRTAHAHSAVPEAAGCSIAGGSHPTPPKPWRAVLGGVVGTMVMTLMMYFVAPMMLGRPMDIAAMLGGTVGSWGVGMLMHFVNGSIIFPLVYAYLLYRILPGEPWLKGTIWGLILWLLSQILVMPMMGAGLFSARAGGLMAVMASLIAHAIYGAVLGAVTQGSSTPSRGRVMTI